MIGLRLDCPIRNWAVHAEMGPHPEGVRGAKTIRVYSVLRVFVTPLQIQKEAFSKIFFEK